MYCVRFGHSLWSAISCKWLKGQPRCNIFIYSLFEPIYIVVFQFLFKYYALHGGSFENLFDIFLFSLFSQLFRSLFINFMKLKK